MYYISNRGKQEQLVVGSLKSTRQKLRKHRYCHLSKNKEKGQWEPANLYQNVLNNSDSRLGLMPLTKQRDL